MRVRGCIKKFFLESIYVIVMAIFLFWLNDLNHELLAYNFTGAFELLKYRNYIALKFFGLAVAFFIAGCYLLYRRVKIIQTKVDSFDEMMISFAAIVIIVVLLILLIIFIDNPILKAVLTVALIIVGGIAFGME